VRALDLDPLLFISILDDANVEVSSSPTMHDFLDSAEFEVHKSGPRPKGKSTTSRISKRMTRPKAIQYLHTSESKEGEHRVCVQYPLNLARRVFRFCTGAMMASAGKTGGMGMWATATGTDVGGRILPTGGMGSGMPKCLC